jgi:transglutaminase-like putative cysteine protease
MDVEQSRKFSEYTVTLLAPSTSVIYAPDEPLTVSVPTVYDYRGERQNYGSLRPVAPIREQQRSSVLASVSSASASELRQAGSAYPAWVTSYLQLPAEVPDRLRRESRRIIAEATNPYDAAINIQQYLRTFTYSTKVPVPPAGRDWVSFLVFESKEGYCDYFATGMTVMLRAVGIPARVASGYVTGDWDASTQSYVATEHHAHSWTEVYFPGYGWITFEPSANRPAPVRPEVSLSTSFFDQDVIASSIESDFDDFPYEDEDFGSSGFVPLPSVQTGPNHTLVGVGAGAAGMLLLGSVLGALFFWVRGIRRLPLVARPYAQLVRLATWCGVGPRPSQTPYEYGRELERVVPRAADRIQTITRAYVDRVYGAKDPDESATALITTSGVETRKLLIQTLALGRWRAWVAARLGRLTGSAERTRA